MIPIRSSKVSMVELIPPQNSYVRIFPPPNTPSSYVYLFFCHLTWMFKWNLSFCSILFLEDLQAEIDEIDDDIASIRKELRVSDTSDTSLPEEMITFSVAEQQKISLSDSPEFWAGHLACRLEQLYLNVCFRSKSGLLFNTLRVFLNGIL